jgi:small subunit ribosomal protein S2e
MSEAQEGKGAPRRGGFGQKREGGRPAGPGGPGGRPGGPGGRRERPGAKDEKTWTPLTKLGKLVRAGKVSKLEEIYLHSLPIKEPEIVDKFLEGSLKEEMMKIKPVQKQTQAGQRTRFQAYIAVGDGNGHIGIGVKVAKEAQLAIKGAISLAKLSLVPVRRGYWGNKIGLPHTVAMKVTGKCGSVSVRLVPAPRGTGVVAPPACKKILHLAGVNDCYTSAKGKTKTTGNFVTAAYFALANTYRYLTPDLWPVTSMIPTPHEKHSEFLSGKATY